MKFGIIGTGSISDRFFDSLRFAKAKATAVFSRSFTSGSRFAERHGIKKSYTDMDEFLQSDIDAVYIASPNSCHKKQTMVALAAGKHVLVEKPAAPSLREFEEMLAFAKEKKLILMEAIRPVHDPAYALMQQEMPRIGRVRMAILDFCQYSSRYDRFKQGSIDNAFQPELSNAALLDIGVYPLSVAVMLFGKPRSVSGHSVFLHTGFEGSGTVTLEYDHFNAVITYSKICQSISKSVVLGEYGGFSIDKLSNPMALHLHTNDGHLKRLPMPPYEADDNMFYEVADFMSYVKAKCIPDEITDITRNTLEVMDEVRRQNGIVFPSDRE
ncbi:MAG: Gfo/Idh/MocA family oxidoreductase [Clostridia bacterium]|nr:Gfo/Idh/MocA family oxidoreductase [Clostridia bacterium]